MPADETIFASLATAAISIGTAWGIIRSQVDAVMKENDFLKGKIERIETEYVTHKHHDAVVTPLQRMTEEIQRDVKKLLTLVIGRAK